MPAISVVIPAKDAAATLGLTLQSLAAQTFRDFEVVLVDDGSADTTGEIAARHAGALALRTVRHARPQGIARALNAGIAAAQAPLIARLDADDLAREDRLAVQWQFMQEHPGIDICGSQMAMFTLDGHGQVRAKLLAHPAHDAAIRTTFVHENPLAHPSLLIRRGFFERVGLYDPDWDTVEDMHLWARGALAGARYANLPLPLTSYRLHDGQVSRTRAQLQVERDLAVKRLFMQAMLPGRDLALAVEWLSSTCRFPTAEAAWEALPDSLPVLTALAACLPDAATYHRLLHLRLAHNLRR